MPASPEKDVAVGLSFTFIIDPGGIPVQSVIDDRQIIDFQLPGAAVELLPASDQSTVDVLDFDAVDLHDPGKFRCTVYHFQDYDAWDEIGREATLEITTPSGAKITVLAVLESYEVQQATLNGRMIADVVFQLQADPSAIAAPV